METKDTLSSCSNLEAQQMQQIEDKAKKSCMISFRQLHSHLKRLSQNDLQGTRTESGFKRAFATLFGQDIKTFTGIMFLNVEQLEKQLDKEDFQEIGSMAAFNVLETQFQMFIMSRIYLNDEYVAMTRSYFQYGTDSKEHDTSSRSGNDAHDDDDADIRPIYDEKLMAEKPLLQSHRKQSVVRQPTAFKSERPGISKPRFASQVDVNNDLSKPVTTHYFPKEREVASAKPHHMIASSNSRISSKNMPRFSSNDMVHNHYLEKAKKKTQEHCRNSEPSLMPPARSQSTDNGSKPKPKINNQNSRNWHASKNSFVTTKTVPIAEHSRNSRNFSDSKHFVCSTCQKCVFNANHDSCLTKLMNEINLHAQVSSNKTTNKNKHVEQIIVPNKQERQISIGHRISIKKTSVVQKKTMTPRSCLSWKPTARIFKIVVLRWVPTRKIFTSSITEVDNEPPNSSNADITNQYECEKTLDVIACTLNLSACTSFNPKKEGLRVWLLKRLISPKPGLQGILI
uniref:Uncharacterized protein n=1 Tax=Tanacetum cinerariifolium TaxID=118510 RepID=A0A6L2MIB6_TANCI|nr:hypothetical protein [Tanacetum cinerariifolium]